MAVRINRMAIIVAVLAAIFFLSSGAVIAGPNDPETPASLKGGKVIAVEEAKALVDRKAAAVFDMRTALNYGKGHIPTAVSVPFKGKSENTPDFDLSAHQVDFSKFPKDKKAKVIIYSDGPKGWKSYKMAVAAIKAGYTDVMWLRDGFAVWEKKNYPLEQ